MRLAGAGARARTLYRQAFVRGVAQSPLQNAGPVHNRRGTQIRFRPDMQIFGPAQRFSPQRLYRLCRSKAYLFRGARIRSSCDPALIRDDTPAEAALHFPGGLRDSLAEDLGATPLAIQELWAGEATLPASHGHDTGRVEWAAAWVERGDSYLASYCNTVPTPQGG